MRCNIYRGDRLLEENKFFHNLIKAISYCDIICPQKYGDGKYHAVIVKR